MDLLNLERFRPSCLYISATSKFRSLMIDIMHPSGMYIRFSAHISHIASVHVVGGFAGAKKCLRQIRQRAL
jgi:hypothetical protein